MNRQSRFPIFSLLPIATAALALLGCQQESTHPPETASEQEYALEVQKLKAGPDEALEAGLAALDAKFGFEASAPIRETVPSPVSDEVGALQKAAASNVLSVSGQCLRLSKGIFHASEGDQIFFRARSINEVNKGISDPVAFLIQFTHAGFIANGEIPKTAQVPVKILAWNDDAVQGNLSSYINYTFKAGENGYFMWIVAPLTNANSTRITSLSLDMIQATCPNCDYVITPSIRTLGGMIYKSAGANDFRASRTTAVGDPRVYVFKIGGMTGMSNGNSSTLTTSSKVYPYEVLRTNPAQFIIIDNEAGGTGEFTHTQYTP